MIRGAVNDSLEAVIPLDLLADDESVSPVNALVDTGFNGDLSLPRRIIDLLGCESAGERKVELGDGLISVMRCFSGRVLWQGAGRVVSILEGCGPLIGMNLLRGCKLVVEVEPEGHVEVTG